MADSFSGSLFSSLQNAFTPGAGDNYVPQTDFDRRLAALRRTPQASTSSAPKAGENAAMARRIQATLKELRTQVGDGGKVYRRTLKAIRAAGNAAQMSAVMLLPYESDMPSGFTRRNNKTWATSRTNRTRAFPTYERTSARMGIQVKTLRGRAKMTETGWVGAGVDGVEIIQTDAAGNIFDIAGRKGGSTESGKRLIALFDDASRFNAPLFRILVPAVVETKPQILREINRALDEAQAAVNRAGGTD